MKKYLFLILSWCLIEPSLGAVEAPITKIDENTYTTQLLPNLHLTMQRVTQDNVEFWTKYTKYSERLNTFNPGQKHDKVLTNAVDGTTTMRQFLELYQPYREFPQIWIVFASYKAPSELNQYLSEGDRNAERTLSQFEMTMSVSTVEGGPFVCHMGIGRSPAAIVFKKPYHKNLATSLHTFAAKVIGKREPDVKQYVLSAPVPKMREILLNALPKGTITIGDSIYQQALEIYLKGGIAEKREYTLRRYDYMFKRAKTAEKKEKEMIDFIERSAGKYASIYEEMLKYECPPSPITIDEELSLFILKDKTNNIILELHKEGDGNYFWFFKGFLGKHGRMHPYITIDFNTLRSLSLLETV